MCNCRKTIFVLSFQFWQRPRSTLSAPANNYNDVADVINYVISQQLRTMADKYQSVVKFVYSDAVCQALGRKYRGKPELTDIQSVIELADQLTTAVVEVGGGVTTHGHKRPHADVAKETPPDFEISALSEIFGDLKRRADVCCVREELSTQRKKESTTAADKTTDQLATYRQEKKNKKTLTEDGAKDKGKDNKSTKPDGSSTERAKSKSSSK